MESVTRQVQVTQEHINAGCRNDGGNCPVALAFLATFPEFELYHVYERSVVVEYGGWQKSFDLPEEACEFIKNFDAQKDVDPFTFDLTVTV